jgi:hypothetical protein
MITPVSSFLGMFLFIFLMSKKQSSILLFMLISCRFGMSYAFGIYTISLGVFDM